MRTYLPNQPEYTRNNYKSLTANKKVYFSNKKRLLYAINISLT